MVFARTFLAVATLSVLAASAPAQTLPGFSLNTNNSTFTYDDPDDPGAVVTGFIRKPTNAANGQAIIICHGKGGSSTNFNAQHAANLVTWGFYCIVPQLSHAGAGGGTSSNEGYCPENSRIGRACLKILSNAPIVDIQRVAMFGHSMGAYFTGGFCGENPAPYPPIRAAVEGAGGAQGSGNATNNALPTPAEVAGITAPMLLFHGTQDTSYPRSQDLKASLDSHGVSNRLVLYQEVPHSIMDANQKRTDIYAISRAWFTTHGVLAYSNNTAPTMNIPATVRVAAGVASIPLPVLIGDNETAVSSLTVQAFSADADVVETTTPPVPAYSGRLNNSGLVWGGSGSNRTLTITPTAAVTGTVEVALAVTDGTVSNGQLAAVKYLNVVIQSSVPPLALGSSQGGAALTAQQSAAVGASLTASGGTAPYVWTLAGGTLPTGVTLGTNGALDGVPAQAGVFGFTAFVQDSASVMGSQAYTLTVSAPASNAPPVLGAIADRVIVAGATLSITNAATDAGSPPQTLTYSLLAAPVGASLNTTNGLLTWRPAIALADTTNIFQIIVADNGTPPLGATQSFSVTVTAPATPQMTAPVLTNGGFRLMLLGSAGPDYTLEASEDLSVWQALFTTSPPVVPFFWSDRGASNYPLRFYRIILGP